MKINVEGRLYIKDNQVYFGYNPLTVHDQRGRKFVKHRGRQINLKNIPHFPGIDESDDPVFDYVFKGGFQHYPCLAMDYWIARWRMKQNISTRKFKNTRLNKTRVRN